MKIEKFASKMDKFGVLAFLYVIIYSIIALVKETNFMSWILLFVGIGGFLVDLYVIINTNKK
mgnify:CR=1 FL=1